MVFTRLRFGIFSKNRLAMGHKNELKVREKNSQQLCTTADAKPQQQK